MTAKQSSDEMLREAMLDELRQELHVGEIPAHAMSFHQLREKTGASEEPLRHFLQAQMALGLWKKQRQGLTVLYWKVQP